jgi:hypothetical protein
MRIPVHRAKVLRSHSAEISSLRNYGTTILDLNKLPLGIIDKKSLFVTPRSPSTHTGRKHAGNGLEQRIHGEESVRNAEKRHVTAKQRLCG